MVPPYGISTLLLTCFDPADSQFRGILKAVQVLARQRRVYHHDWQNNSIDLYRRRTLRSIVISGHAQLDQPLFIGPIAELRPEHLRLPRQASLYLMGCHQGRETLRREWARGTGLPVERIHGCSGETESALSTCLLLHLLADGLETLPVRFEDWIRCNDTLRPHFRTLRELYRLNDGHPLATLDAFARQTDLSPIDSFVSISRRFPGYLTGL